MAIWSRDKQFGAGVGGFTAADGADGANNNSIVPSTTRFGLIFSNIVDATLTRSKTLATALYRSLQSQLHKEEDRATGSNIGVSGTGIESTQTVYTTPEQLPEVSKTTNDFSTPAKSDSNGVLTTTQDLFNVTPATTDRKNKNYVVKLSDAGVLFFKARTWLQSELVTLINSTVGTSVTNTIRVGTITYTAHSTDDEASKNLIVDTRTIGKGSSGATLNDDKYETLWKHLYDKYPDAICTLNVARTTRDADWLANRTLTLPKIYGRVLVGKDGTQTEFDTIGETGGEKTHLLTGAESGISPNLGIEARGGGNQPNDDPSCLAQGNTDGGSKYSNTPVIKGTTTANSAHNNLQPYVVLNAQITY